jgi:hypothetical protein
MKIDIRRARNRMAGVAAIASPALDAEATAP